MKTPSEVALAEKDEAIAKYRSQIESLSSAYIEVNARRLGVPELLLPHFRSQVRMVADDGKMAERVVNSKGEARIGDAAGNPMTMAGLVAEMRRSSVYGRVFEDSKPVAPKSGNGKNSIARASFDLMSPVERAGFVKAGGTLSD